jgi:hypothetical protein
VVAAAGGGLGAAAFDDSDPEDDEDRILIFSTDHLLDMLQDSKDWGCDGTFSVTPNLSTNYGAFTFELPIPLCQPSSVF